jgi:hypothetical protein
VTEPTAVGTTMAENRTRIGADQCIGEQRGPARTDWTILRDGR